jgi:hypothetical protein
MAKSLKKFPNQPKIGSSVSVWERYKKKCDEVTKYNAGIMAERKKKDAIKSAVKKQKEKQK